MAEETIITDVSEEKNQKQQLQNYYCEVCGIDVESDTDLRRFGKLFCSDPHLNMYVRARQRKMGILEEDGGMIKTVMKRNQ